MNPAADDEKSLTGNKGVPTKAYPCPICDKIFRGASSRIIHVRRHHTGEKPFVCKAEGCGKAFHSSSALGVHRRIHDENRKLYPCLTCGKELRTKNGLDYHVKSIHLLDRPFRCTMEGCNASFMTKKNLNNHTKKHNRETEKAREQATRMVEQLRKKNTALRSKLSAETKRAHEMELKVRKLVRRAEKGPKVAGRLKPIKTNGEPLPKWVPPAATGFFVPEDEYLMMPLSNLRVIIRDKHGLRIQGLEEFREPSRMRDMDDGHGEDGHGNEGEAAAALSAIGTDEQNMMMVGGSGPGVPMGMSQQEKRDAPVDTVHQVPKAKRARVNPETRRQKERQKLLRMEFSNKPELANAGISFQSWSRGLGQQEKDALFQKLPPSPPSMAEVEARRATRFNAPMRQQQQMPPNNGNDGQMDFLPV